MAFYQYECENHHAWEHVRPAAKRHDPTYCDKCGGPGHKVMSVPVIHWPRSLWNQWSDVYPDISEKEMAKRKDVERYDPTYHNKPTPDPINMKPFMPTLAEAEGASERLKLTPVEGEGSYD